MANAMDSVRAYLEGPFRSVNGWCGPHLWQVIEPLHAALAKEGPAAPVAEIGVFHGKFFIGLLKTMQANARNTAIDVFDLQRFNLDGAGAGNLSKFKENLAVCGVESNAFDVMRADSMALSRRDIDELRSSTGGFSMFSVDGCHKVEHTINDIRIAMNLTLPHGAIFVDDYYNPDWPGVHEGVSKLFLTDSPRFVPVAFLSNKLILCNISFHSTYLKAIGDHVRKHHPTTRIKSVERYGYCSLSLAPDVSSRVYLAAPEN
jgi:hypothetical protein